jgi:prepilin-type N-terminal cleavage/methylation domain-containing protein
MSIPLLCKEGKGEVDLSFSARKKGFTLIEALLAIVVISALVAAMANIMISGMRSYRLVVDRREALQNARLALNMMANELAKVANPAADISSIGATSITFTKAGGGSVTYSVSGTNLMIGSSVLARNVANGTGFAYYTAGGAVTANPAQVHRIQMTLVVNAATASSGTVTATEDVYLRNRYFSGFTQL